MEFFISAAADETQAQRVYDAIKDFLRSEIGAECDHRHAFSCATCTMAQHTLQKGDSCMLSIMNL